MGREAGGRRRGRIPQNEARINGGCRKAAQKSPTVRMKIQEVTQNRKRTYRPETPTQRHA